MAEESGFKIGDTLYEFPSRFRMGDTVLVEELTGVSFTEFSERFDAVQDGVGDPVVLVGLLGVSVWQANPRWKRDRVVAFVNEVDLATFETVGGGDDIPPTVGVAPLENRSPEPSDEFTNIPEPLEIGDQS